MLLSVRVSRPAARWFCRARRLGCSLTIGVLAAVPLSWAEEPWRAPPPARSRRNPLPPSAALVGAQLFAAYCATCHGAAGRGDGLAGAALNPRPRDLTSWLVQKEPDGALFWKITSGRGAMPAWPWLSERERWALVWTIREFGRTAGGGATR